jgi:O-antigen ligase
MIEAAARAPAFRRKASVAHLALPRQLDGERLALGLSAVVVALLPLAVPTGPANTAPIDVLIAVAFAACILWAGTAGHPWRFPFAPAVALLLVGGALGALVGPVPGKGAVAVVQDLELVGWCWAVANISRSAANLKVLLSTWVYSAIWWAVMPLIGLATGSALLTGQTENQGGRVQITLADPSYAAGYFFISIMIMWATGRPRRRPLRLIAYALLVTGIALTGSNSGAVSLIVGTAVAAAVAIYRRYGVAPAATAVAFLAVGIAFLGSTVSLTHLQERAHDSRYAFVRDGLGRGTSFEQRGMLFQESLRLFRDGSVLGEGPVSTKPRLENEMAPFQKEAHDDYLAALLERGIIGFLGVVLLAATLGRRAVSLVRTKLTEPFAAVVTRPHALVGAVAGTMVAMTVYEFLHVRHVWTLFAVVAALCIWSRE